MSTIWQKGVDGRSRWRTGIRETEVRLDGWCEAMLGIIAISFSLSFYRDKFFTLVIDLSVSQCFCSKISDNR